jgi:hypothetical protein
MALAHIDAALHVHPETIVLMALAVAAIAALAFRALARKRG